MKVIIIGNGIVGASAAYHLAKNNIKVIIVDKEHEGNATAAGAGIICPWTNNSRGDDWYNLAVASARFYPQLISDLKSDREKDVSYKKVGALFVSSDLEKLNNMEKELNIKQKSAPEMGEIIRLTKEQTVERFPPIDRKFESILISGGARVDGKLLRDAISRAAQTHGAKMIKGEAELLVENNQATGVKVNGETIKGDIVLITAGAWAPKLLAPHGIELQVEPQRGQIAHLNLPDTDTSNWPVILPDGSSHYMLAFDDSRVVIGATRETGSGFDYRTTAGGLQEIISEGLTVAPGLSEATVAEIRIGFRPAGPDFLPILGRMKQLGGAVLANGLGASGLTMGPYIGKLAASIVQEEKLEIDIGVYDPQRAL